MTFDIALSNADQIIHVSDRKLTSNCNKPLSCNKSGSVLCDDAVLLYSFSGLASYEKFNTNKWIVDTFCNVGRSANNYYGIIEKFVEQASATLKEVHCSKSDKRLTIMVTGYLSNGHIVCSLISNFQDFNKQIDSPEADDSFTVYKQISKETIQHNSTCINVIGQFGEFTEDYEKELREMLSDRKDKAHILSKVLSIIKRMSEGNTTIGDGANYIILEQINNALSFGFVTDKDTKQVSISDYINLRSGSKIQAIHGLNISSDATLARPFQSKNSLCHCGSKKKYKRCHGKLSRRYA